MNQRIVGLFVGLLVLVPSLARAKANCGWSLLIGGPVLGSTYRHTCCVNNYCCSRDYIDMWLPITGVTCTNLAERPGDPGASETPVRDECLDESEPLQCMPDDGTIESPTT